MFCGRCGGTIGEGEAFCARCGAPADTPAQSPGGATPPAQPGPAYPPSAPYPAPAAAPAYPAVAPYPPPAAQPAAPPKKRRGCVIAVVVVIVLLLCSCCGVPAALMASGRTIDLGEVTAPDGLLRALGVDEMIEDAIEAVFPWGDSGDGGTTP